MRAPHLIPFRQAAPGTARASLVRVLGTLVVALAILGALLAAPAPAAQAAAASAAAGDRDEPRMPAGCFGPGQPQGTDPDKPCHFNRFVKSHPTVVLWGDSHAWQYIPAVKAAVKGTRVNLVSFVAGSCAPFALNKSPTGVCERSNRAALDYVKRLHRRGSKVKALLGSNWAGFRMAYRRLQLEAVGIDSGYEAYTKRMVKLSHEGTPALFSKLGRMGIDVDVIAQSAVVPDRTPDCAAGNDPYQCDIARWRALREEGRTASWLQREMRKLTGRTRYIETTDAYCDALVCHGTVGGIATFFDHLHLSRTRTATLAPYFTATFTSMKADHRR